MKTFQKAQVNTVEPVFVRDTRVDPKLQNFIKMSAFTLDDGVKEFANLDSLLEQEQRINLASQAAYENSQMLLKLNGLAKLSLIEPELKAYENLTDGMHSLLVQLTQESRQLSRLISLFCDLNRV